MTYRQLYLQGKQTLTSAGVDSPGFDAALLMERFLGLDRPGLALKGEQTPPPEAESDYLRAVEQRVHRRPLQYILGEWEFMGLRLHVGEGVLIPREDTSVLVEALAQHLRGTSAPRGLDLCAGSGAVALGLCSLLPDVEVTCVELDDAAAQYLAKNINRYTQYHVRLARGDVLSPQTAGNFRGNLDFIAANPPYIAAEELPGLQAEVRREPELALNGGPDGLIFYRAIAANWVKLLHPDGILAVEIGETQAEAVRAIFHGAGLDDITVLQDLAGLDRVVWGRYRM